MKSQITAAYAGSTFDVKNEKVVNCVRNWIIQKLKQIIRIILSRNHEDIILNQLSQIWLPVFQLDRKCRKLTNQNNHKSTNQHDKENYN